MSATLLFRYSVVVAGAGGCEVSWLPLGVLYMVYTTAVRLQFCVSIDALSVCVCFAGLALILLMSMLK